MKLLTRLRGRSQGDDRGLAISHYDDLSQAKVMGLLSRLSPLELTAIENHERSHQARPAVLEKLHYLGQGGVDAATVNAVRDYENKGRRRREASDRVARESGHAARNELEALSEEARYHRERLDLYRAKLYGGRAISQLRLRELERAADGAASRLRHAQRSRSA